MDFSKTFWFAQIICTGVATMVYWRQRAAIIRLRSALWRIRHETCAPYMWPVGEAEKLLSWSVIHAICIEELRSKRW